MTLLAAISVLLDAQISVPEILGAWQWDSEATEHKHMVLVLFPDRQAAVVYWKGSAANPPKPIRLGAWHLTGQRLVADDGTHHLELRYDPRKKLFRDKGSVWRLQTSAPAWSKTHSKAVVNNPDERKLKLAFACLGKDKSDVIKAFGPPDSPEGYGYYSKAGDGPSLYFYLTPDGNNIANLSYSVGTEQSGRARDNGVRLSFIFLLMGITSRRDMENLIQWDPYQQEDNRYLSSFSTPPAYRFAFAHGNNVINGWAYGRNKNIHVSVDKHFSLEQNRYIEVEKRDIRPVNFGNVQVEYIRLGSDVPTTLARLPEEGALFHSWEYISKTK